MWAWKRCVHYHTQLCNGKAAQRTCGYQTIPYERRSPFRNTTHRAQYTKETTKLQQIVKFGRHESKLCSTRTIEGSGSD
jgi:hypothetical protein